MMFLWEFLVDLNGAKTPPSARADLEKITVSPSVTSPATPRIPVVAGRVGWWCSCSDPGAIDQSIVQPAAVPGRKLSRSLTVTHVRSGERRPPVAGGRLLETWVEIEDACLPEVAMPPCNSSGTTMKPPAATAARRACWVRRAKRSTHRRADMDTPEMGKQAIERTHRSNWRPRSPGRREPVPPSG